MRQHVNPLSRFFQLPLELPCPDQLFDTANRPIHLDIGCARGVCLLELSALKPDWNHLGVEIRRPLVLAAQRDRDKLERHNLHYLFCNANISLEGWLAGLSADHLQLVSIQFPDPWFKRRHRKRRVMQPSLLLAIAAALSPSRELFLQSDVLEVVEPMVTLVELCGCFDRPAEDSHPWRADNPLPVPTERERYVQEQGLPAYRVLYRRNKQPLPKLEELEMAWQRVDNPDDVPLNH